MANHGPNVLIKKDSYRRKSQYLTAYFFLLNFLKNAAKESSSCRAFQAELPKGYQSPKTLRRAPPSFDMGVPRVIIPNPCNRPQTELFLVESSKIQIS